MLKSIANNIGNDQDCIFPIELNKELITILQNLETTLDEFLLQVGE